MLDLVQHLMKMGKKRRLVDQLPLVKRVWRYFTEAAAITQYFSDNIVGAGMEVV